MKSFLFFNLSSSRAECGLPSWGFSSNATSHGSTCTEMSNYLQFRLFVIWALITADLVASQDFLIFAATTGSPLMTTRPTVRSTGDFVLVNNSPVVGTMTPFITNAAAPTQAFINCFGRCPTTPEYNPICASNRQLYLNEQKFNCARFCGADIRIVRRGSCEGLFPMQRG
ncbi:uncharacterized protein LOC6576243 [Drosophila mojavensis]|uniref:Kazal-like domain-containing protein n=1 Tax=Drosophila mojavensis TaxID=7230 RepID=B4KKU7_DROMO|nr:uncharacterized protein LOC6576243 [Drosophila mojavensis]EDW11677.2 uncharacterized protein Dmoj_GI17274 [Drosophila mojavensis]